MPVSVGQAVTIRRLALVPLLLLGCRSAPPGQAQALEASPQKTRAAQTLRLCIDAEPLHLNPAIDIDRWGFRLAFDNIYEPLLRAAGDGRYVGVLADHFTREEDGRTYVFHLRSGVRFHDGHPFGVDDVLFTVERAAAPGAGHALAALGGDIAISAPTPDTVRVTTQTAAAYLLPRLAELGILPAHVFASTPSGEWSRHPANRHPVGTGPYHLRRWDPGHHLELERTADYWGEPPAFSRVDIDIEPDAVAALGQAKRGEIDVLGRVAPFHLPEQLESPSISSGYRSIRTAPARLVLVLWNTRRPPLDRVDVRRALTLAVDRNALLSAARHGQGRLLGAPPLDAGLLPRRPDPAAAAAALQAAHVLPGVAPAASGPRARLDRTRNTVARRLTLLVPAGSYEAEELGRRLAESFGKVGFPIDLALGDLGAILRRLHRGNFDGAVLVWNGHDDDDLAPLFHNRGTHNFGGYDNSDVDEIIDRLKMLPLLDSHSQREHRRLRERLAALLADDAPALFLYAPEDVYLYSRRLRLAPPRGDFFLLREAAPQP